MIDAPLLLKQEHWLVSDEVAQLTGDRRSPFTLALAVRLRRPINDRAVRQTLDHLTRRHAALRSAFVRTSIADRHEQLRSFVLDKQTNRTLYRHVVHDRVELPVHVSRLDGVPEVAWRESWIRAGKTAFMSMLDPASPPLARAALIEVDREHADLVFVIHHLIADRESLDVISRDIRALYTHFVDGGDRPALPPTLEYLEAMRCLARSTEAERQRATDYWLRRWSSTPTELLSWETPPSSEDSHTAVRPGGATAATKRRAIESVHLGEELIAAARRCGAEHRTTLYVICLSAFALALSRWLESQVVAVWISVDNRWRAGDGELVAWTANSHVIAIEVPWDATGTSLLQRVRKLVVETIEHGHIPGVEVTRRTGQSPPSSRPWVMFDLFRVPGRDTDGGRGRVSALDAAPGVTFALGDFVLHIYAQATSARCIVGYPSHGRVTSASIREMLDSYASTLSALASNPQRPLSELYQSQSEAGQSWRSSR